MNEVPGEATAAEIMRLGLIMLLEQGHYIQKNNCSLHQDKMYGGPSIPIYRAYNHQCFMKIHPTAEEAVDFYLKLLKGK